jgi:DNA-directed RNA polymerase specialized sigma24 family protein
LALTATHPDAAHDLEARRLQTLLERLRADSASGGFGYEQLRRRLILFFRQREPIDAETLADEALDRLARRLDEGVQINHPAPYAFGIAKMMLFEANARRLRQEARFDEPENSPAMIDDDDVIDPALVLALRTCLRSMGRRGSELMLAYYRDDDARRIKTRRNLAEKLGVTVNTLRNRVLRLRTALEACVRGRMTPGATEKHDGFAQNDTPDDD